MTLWEVDNRLGLGLIRQPTTVVFGPGQRSQLSWLVRTACRHVMMVTDARMAGTPDFDGMRRQLEAAGVRTLVFDGAEPDVPKSNIDDAAAQARAAAAAVDGVIGIGGGSCMDLAKAVSVALTNEGDVASFFGEFNVPKPGLPVYTVPTTGGTGAEVTCLAVIYDKANGLKVSIASPMISPVAAVIDPELTLGCPPGLTAATAADALSHLIEGYTARARNPSPEELATRIYAGKNRLTDMFAEKGLVLINSALERVVANPGDIDARADMMFAAYCAGMVINTTGTAACHAIQAPMASVSRAPHGFGVGALLPYVTRYNLPERVAEFAQIARLFGVAEASQPQMEQARAAIRRIEALLEVAGAPVELKSLGLEPAHFERVADAAMGATRLVLNNPHPMTREGVLQILQRGYDDDRSWWVAA